MTDTAASPAASHINVADRGPALLDFLRTVMKFGGSDLHLQSGSMPMIRVDGRARFLGCACPTEEQMDDFVRHPHSR